ncbi:hypothetical protein B0H15DRAFT_796624 [Mycena belliarum]|uniref:Uncharacterized protein n=1 Tax=Mycena belliarum TaxID=1033014 RepID=A0AAD6UEU7_9AGAR|nr:hypothetical protein B0H15DRAFT_796624 [Mycena belliae]
MSQHNSGDVDPGVVAARYGEESSSESRIRDNDLGDALLRSAKSLLRTSHSAEEPRESQLTSSKTLRLLSALLHAILVALHLLLLGIWATRLEHRAIFSLAKQSLIHPAITVVSNTFGTVYTALLVYVTQTLSMRRSLQTEQTLTATHDTASAWAGIGSAVVGVWNQKAVPASLGGVLAAFMYLGSVLVLHITTPALFSVETFSSVQVIDVGTQGLPAFNATLGAYNSTLYHRNFSTYAYDRMYSYVYGSLYFLPSVLGSPPNQTLGLDGGTLYDVLGNNTGTGTALINATGFNITCGYLADVHMRFSPNGSQWSGTTDGTEDTLISIQTAEPGIITRPALAGNTWLNSLNTLVLYSTIAVLDSTGSRGPTVNLDLPINDPVLMGSTVSAVQFLACSQTLVSQTAMVEAQSHQSVGQQPQIQKTTSAWRPFNGPTGTFNPNNALDTRPNSVLIYLVKGFLLRTSRRYLMQRLDLHKPGNGSLRTNVTLHELENALSELIASMFWTLGHIAPAYGNQVDGPPILVDGRNMSTFTIAEIPKLFTLVQGSSEVNQTVVMGRLDLSITMTAVHDEDHQINGTGILHAIWMYRNHPELKVQLEQVDYPTDDSLRDAGMVSTRLVKQRLRDRKSREPSI